MKNKLIKVLLLVILSCCILGNIMFINTHVATETSAHFDDHFVFASSDINNASLDYEPDSDSLPIMPMSLDSLGHCYGVNCGSGREDGYNANYLTNGCRNWAKFTHIYGPRYWINEATLSGLTPAQRAQFIANVDNAANVWNSTKMHDGTGTIVSLVKESSDGSGICEVRYEPSLSGMNGLYNSFTNVIQIKNWNSTKTPIHEFGHLLGLDDLDTQENIVHSVMMGYWTSSNEQIHYQDIQGLAAIRTNHVHDYKRYVQNGNKYEHFCFYCDIRNVQSSVIQGSHMQLAATCMHTYQQIVSAGDRHWIKCTKCYKVIESDIVYEILTATTIEIMKFLNTSTTSVTIPSAIEGKTVTRIANNAFSGKYLLSQISIPAGVTFIGNSAFANCTGLGSITLSPSQITYMGSGVFTGCSNLYITVQGASVGFDWMPGWNGGRPVTFTQSGGCGLSHNLTYTANGVFNHTKKCNCIGTVVEEHTWMQFPTFFKCSHCNYQATSIPIIPSRIPKNILNMLIAEIARHGEYAHLHLADGLELYYTDGQFYLLTDYDTFYDDAQMEFYSAFDWFYRIIEQYTPALNYAYD